MIILAVLSLCTWVYLLAAHGRFWQAGPMLAPDRPADSPPVAVVVPARDEAPFIAQSLGSLLAQDYAGDWRVILVDDGSTDGTGAIACGLCNPRLTVLTGAPRLAGWTGKQWAVSQGIAEAGPAEFILLTDADIVHERGHLAALMAQAERADADLVSGMVRLSCASSAERALIPAFVFFFQLLYPFEWVNDPRHRTAAAAGGTMLLRRRALDRIGGIEVIRSALIDDVALAAEVKGGGRIWLGHTALARSIRPYPSAAEIWRMIARSAYVQLRCSPLLLVGCIAGMALVWLVPPLTTLAGHGPARGVGAAAWAGLAWSYLPSLRRYRLSAWRAPFLPLVAAFYMAATIGSAVNHHLGRGVAWKGRAYQGARA